MEFGSFSGLDEIELKRKFILSLYLYLSLYPQCISVVINDFMFLINVVIYFDLHLVLVLQISWVGSYSNFLRVRILSPFTKTHKCREGKDRRTFFYQR